MQRMRRLRNRLTPGSRNTEAATLSTARLRPGADRTGTHAKAEEMRENTKHERATAKIVVVGRLSRRFPEKYSHSSRHPVKRNVERKLFHNS